MRVIYLAHPVTGNVAENLDSALYWYERIQAANPDDAIIMPWYESCVIYDCDTAEEYDIWLRRDCEVVSRCDGLVYAGPSISGGMALEGASAVMTWDRTRLARDCVDAVLVLERRGVYSWHDGRGERP